MLPERVFEIGGVLCWMLGGALVYGFLAMGSPFLGFALSGGMCLGFGSLFVWIGWGARRDRRAFLRMAETGSPAGPYPPRRP
jgi:hypothetical protein